MNLVSVIVPAYNVEPYIERCVSSIVNQTYNNLEIILVDDGSTDGTGTLCDELAVQDSRIKVIHKENGGQADARNVGIDTSTGDYLSFVDSDDYIELDMYENMVKEMADESVSLVAVGMVVTDTAGKDEILVSEKRIYLSREEALLNLFENGKLFPSSSNKMFRRELFQTIRYVKGIINEDTEIIFRIINECNRILLLDRADYHYVLRNGSTMRSKFGEKEYRSLIAYKTAVRICKGYYPNLVPYAQYYELKELYEAQAKLADSGNYEKRCKFSILLRLRTASAILKCIRWSQIRGKYSREIMIYMSSVILGYRFTYQLMMAKQRIKGMS